jgi:hypothetical protein
MLGEVDAGLFGVEVEELRILDDKDLLILIEDLSVLKDEVPLMGTQNHTPSQYGVTSETFRESSFN